MTRIAYALILTCLVVGCSKSSSSTELGAANKPAAALAELVMKDIEPGTGPAAKKGDTVLVLYVGKFVDGKVFDSNMDDSLKPDMEKQPYPVVIGTGGVIQGWDEGLVGAKEGMVRKLEVPWSKAYGAEDSDKIPGKSDLMFTVKIVKLIQAGTTPAIEVTDIKTGSGAKITANSTIKFRYKSSLLNGKVFDDQSKGVASPVARLVPWFKEAIMGMMAGGERKLSIPPNLANPTGQIPPGQPYEIVVSIDEVK